MYLFEKSRIASPFSRDELITRSLSRIKGTIHVKYINDKFCLLYIIIYYLGTVRMYLQFIPDAYNEIRRVLSLNIFIAKLSILYNVTQRKVCRQESLLFIRR